MILQKNYTPSYLTNAFKYCGGYLPATATWTFPHRQSIHSPRNNLTVAIFPQYHRNGRLKRLPAAFHMGPFEVGLFTNYFRHVICPYLYTGSTGSVEWRSSFWREVKLYSGLSWGNACGKRKFLFRNISYSYR